MSIGHRTRGAKTAASLVESAPTSHKVIKRTGGRRVRTARGRIRAVKRVLRREQRVRLAVLGTFFAAGVIVISLRNDVYLHVGKALPSVLAIVPTDTLSTWMKGTPSASSGEADAPVRPTSETTLGLPVTAWPTGPSAAAPRAGASTGKTIDTEAPSAGPAELTTNSADSGTGDVAGDDDRSPDEVLATVVQVPDPVRHDVVDGMAWRGFARRIVDDPVSLDRLLNNLAASGMDTGRVAPGTDVVTGMTADGDRLVRIDAPSGIYVSHVTADTVVTSAHRLVLVAIESTFAADAARAGVPREAIDELLRADASLSLGLGALRPGDVCDVLFRTERELGISHGTTHALALSRGNRLLWTAPGSSAAQN